jgi:hypothetical protein
VSSSLRPALCVHLLYQYPLGARNRTRKAKDQGDKEVLKEGGKAGSALSVDPIR